MNLGKKIRRAREKQSMTQKELAIAVGCSRIHITKIENDRQNPSIFLLQQIAQELCMRKVEEALLVILA